jgi:16S rRNA (uracil1498-N3)-methyltransferase
VIAVAHLPAPALELVLSRCTEAGAFAFHIVQADRSVARGSKPDRWRTICREASMLAGRLVVPEVNGPSPLEDVLKQHEGVVMLSRSAQVRLADVVEPQNLTLLIGPEGGWSEKELALVPQKATLGPRNLRAETAALVALATAVVSRQ